ncbi:MAG: cysteine desulfurase, partial [Fusobacteria bacterium]|nr:cysteine desulfurase [Fusobacteriota bacterium]
MKYIYLDNNATTKIDNRVIDKMLPYITENYGNPSAIYSLGQKAKKEIEEARYDIASYFNVNNDEIVFTSCGSESNNMAIKGIVNSYRDRGNHIITTEIEHHSVLDVFKFLEKEGFEVTYLPVDKNGIVNIDVLKSSIRKETILVSVMYANNEIGTIQPIKEIGKITTEKNIFFHVDAVQVIGKYRIFPKELGIDLMSFSAHKFHGPKGIGGLYVKRGVKLEKYIHGGKQEKNRRAGTENVAGIIGMAKALEIAYENMDINNKEEQELRDYFEEKILKAIPEIYINAKNVERLPGTTSLTIKYVEGESLLLNLDMKGIAVSSGSACASSDLNASHVL